MSPGKYPNTKDNDEPGKIPKTEETEESGKLSKKRKTPMNRVFRLFFGIEQYVANKFLTHEL